jgi:hypothetical protein
MSMTSRQRKAEATYRSRKIVDLGDRSYLIRGRKLRKGGRAPSYHLQPHPQTAVLTCPCEGFDENGYCRHTLAVEKYIAEGEPKVGYDHLDDSKRATYPQDWPRYNMARRVMLLALPPVLRALANHCFPIDRKGTGKPGRPRLQMRTIAYCILLRSVYKRGGDLTQGLVDDAFARKLIYRQPTMFAAPPSTVAITANMRSERVAKAFQCMITTVNRASFGGKPTRLGIDGSEFNTPTLTQGSKGRLINITTVKLHAAVDVDNGTIVCVTVTPGKSGEVEQAVELLETARNLRYVTRFTADRGYVAEELLVYLEEAKIPYAIPTKSNISREGEGILARHRRDWETRSEDEKDEYARRGIVESAFSRLKVLTDEDLRGRTFAAQKVELLSHVLVAIVADIIVRYVGGDIDAPEWIDERSRAILDPVRKIVKDLPRADLSPKYRDGMTDIEAA